MNKISILLLLMVMGAGSAFAVDQAWSFEANSGYDFGFGKGIAVNTYGTIDIATKPYFQRIPNSVANSGFHTEIKLGYAVTPDFSILVGAGLLMGNTTLTGAYSYYSDGSIAHKSTIKVESVSARIAPNLRYTFLRVANWNFFAGVGPLIVIPSPIFLTETNDKNSDMFSDEFHYNIGYGIQSEWGAEYKLNEWVGITLAMALDKLSLSKQKEEYSDGTGTTYIDTYSDKPSTNSDNQTSSDLANTTANKIYHTYQSYPDDFSDISLKAGLIFHF